MTKLLDSAIEKTRRLPEREQDAIAALILEELGEDARWEKTFAATEAALEKLAGEALAEDLAEKTAPLDPNAL